MREKDVVAATSQPGTVDSIKEDLKQLGVKTGMTLLVHSSLSAMGWISGGAEAVILALEAALTPTGTLVMPTHSGGLSDPAHWQNPPVPESWWQTIYETMPAYNPAMTATRQMGVIAETFRKQEGVLRSGHPQVSFAAWGKHAEAVTANQSLDYGMSENSPLARVYDLGGFVLLLGVEHGNNTSLHLAEYRASYPGKKPHQNGSPVIVDGERQWVTLNDINLNEDDFPQIGAAFATDTGLQTTGKVAQAQALLMPQRELVDYAIGWMEKNRE